MTTRVLPGGIVNGDASVPSYILQFLNHLSYTQWFGRWQRGYMQFLEHGRGVMYIRVSKCSSLHECIVAPRVYVTLEVMRRSLAPEQFEASGGIRLDTLNMLRRQVSLVEYDVNGVPHCAMVFHDRFLSFDQFLASRQLVTKPMFFDEFVQWVRRRMNYRVSENDKHFADCIWYAIDNGNKSLVLNYDSFFQHRHRCVVRNCKTEPPFWSLDAFELGIYKSTLLPKSERMFRTFEDTISKCALQEKPELFTLALEELNSDVASFAKQRAMPILRGILLPNDYHEPHVLLAVRSRKPVIWCMRYGPASVGCANQLCVADIEFTTTPLLVCSRCERWRYCSRACAVVDWKRHKVDCVKHEL